MQTLDISEAVKPTNQSDCKAMPTVNLIGVSSGKFAQLQKEFSTFTDNNVRFVKVTEAVDEIIRTTKIAPPGELYQRQLEALEKILCVVAAAHNPQCVTTYADLVAEIHLQNEELARLQALSDSKDLEIARLVKAAHKPLLGPDGKRKVSLTVHSDGSISCR